MKNNPIQSREQYQHSLDRQAHLNKLAQGYEKCPPAFKQELDYLQEAINDYLKRCDSLLSLMDIVRCGFGGIDQNMTIVDRRLVPDATPLPEDRMSGTPAPLPLTKVLFDFYYSHTEAHFNAVETRLYFANLGVGPMTVRSLLTSYFRDNLYTLMVPTGLPKPELFPDYEWVGTGTLSETRMRGKWYEEPTLKQSDQ